jgi:hypothetical protein
MVHKDRGAQGRSPASNPTMMVVKWLGPLRCSKGPDKLYLPAFPTPRTSRSCNNKGNRSCIPNGPLDGWGSAKDQGSKAKPARQVRAA